MNNLTESEQAEREWRELRAKLEELKPRWLYYFKRKRMEAELWLVARKKSVAAVEEDAERIKSGRDTIKGSPLSARRIGLDQRK